MKKLFVPLVLILFFGSCSKKEIPKTNRSQPDSQVVKKEFVVDSVRVVDSLVITKNLTALFDKQVLVFPSIKNKVILDSIYKIPQIAVANYDTKSLKADLNRQMQNSFETTKSDAKEWSPDFAQTWDDAFGMKLISHYDNLLTLLYSGSGFRGGAHGYYFENYKTFDLVNNTVISQNDIFKNPKDPNWDKILKSHFTDKDQKEMMIVDEISLNNNFFFDKDKITFVYNQYEITAYAAGVVDITINFDEVKDLLKPEFVKMYDIR